MKFVKSRVDLAGTILSDPTRDYDEKALELDYLFEEFRTAHLEPLSRLTLELQSWLQGYGKKYYIAQRLKRRPQILRKLRRFSTRLTQLQDIGGCRIIVSADQTVTDLLQFIQQKMENAPGFKIIRTTDYRPKGRDDTGYRAVHVLLEIEKLRFELQIRSDIQHYWAESIERTSVIYGFRLKEKEGDAHVINYFKTFSNALYSLEKDHSLGSAFELELESQRRLAEAIVSQATSPDIFGGHVNENIVRTMAASEGHGEKLNNWILVFDWTDGNFVTWEKINRDVQEAAKIYAKYENEYPEEDKYEVVMIGSSDISTVLHTHSHYFGIEHHNAALEGMDSSIIGLSLRSKLDVGARRILLTLKNRRFWGSKTVARATLKNHFCSGIATFDDSLAVLERLGILTGTDPVSLDIKQNKAIHSLI